MNKSPALTENDIRQYATEKSWARGKEYYENDTVNKVVWRDGILSAAVYGSEYEPYEVEIRFEGDKIEKSSCSCPYDWGGACKHIVAVLCYLVHEAEGIDERPPISDLIATLGKEELADLLIRLVASRPDIAGDIERVLSEGKSTPNNTSVIVPEISQSYLNLLQRQIKADLRGAINSGYDSWGNDSFYDSDLSEALIPALKDAQKYLDNKNPRGALALLDSATKAWDEGINSLDEYVYEAFEDIAEEFTLELGEMWADAILRADLNEKEIKAWADKIDRYIGYLFGGSSLEVALSAAKQGWDYPPLVAAMQGISETGVWGEEEEIPYYADELAKIRLKILDEEGRIQEYLNLAQSEGEFILYLQMLIRQSEYERAYTEAKEHIESMESFHAIARILLEHGEIEKALGLAEYGLNKEHPPREDEIYSTYYAQITSSQQKAALAEWLRDQALKHQRPELALKSARQAFSENIKLENYQKLQEISGEDWQNLHAEVMGIVAQSESDNHKVDIYLYESMYKEAIDVVNKASRFSNLIKVIETVKVEYPGWAFKQCRKQAEEIMDAGRAKDYDVAASWLERGRDILIAAKRNAEWQSYIKRVMDTHQRKYKLMPMLQKISYT